MREAEFVSVRSIVMELLKSRLGGLPVWKNVEAEIAMSCAEMPEPTTPGKLDDFVKRLGRLKEYLLSQEVPFPSLA